MVPYVLAVMFLAGGVVFGLMGYSLLVSTRRKRATWLGVEGTVVDFAEQSEQREGARRASTLYAPVYKYTFDGQRYTATSKVSTNRPRYKVGDPIALVVNPARPNDSDVMDGSTSIFIYGMIGVAVLLVGVGALVAWLAFTGQMTAD